MTPTIGSDKIAILIVLAIILLIVLIPTTSLWISRRIEMLKMRKAIADAQVKDAIRPLYD